MQGSRSYSGFHQGWERVEKNRPNLRRLDLLTARAGRNARRTRALDIQVLYIQRVVFNKLSSRFDVFAHQGGEDRLGFGKVFEFD